MLNKTIKDLDDLFAEKKGNAISFKDKVLIRIDRLIVEKGDVFDFVFESFNSEWKQAVTLDLKGKIIMNKREATKGSILWQDTAPRALTFEVYPKKKQDILFIYNIWDPFGDGSIHSWTMGAAMIREDIPNGARYYCNDGHYDEDFDDLIFTIVKTKGTWEAQALEVIE